MSLSIADAKVETFYILTKHYCHFFLRNLQEKIQVADFQHMPILRFFNKYEHFDKYMLQNIKIKRFEEFYSDGRKEHKKTRKAYPPFIFPIKKNHQTD